MDVGLSTLQQMVGGGAAGNSLGQQWRPGGGGPAAAALRSSRHQQGSPVQAALRWPQSPQEQGLSGVQQMWEIASFT
jgi:hypothetical protein